MSTTRSLSARLRSRDLGVFTWAQLQAAYPNGGAALAALPAGATAFVSDWGAWFVPNPAKTKWRPIGGHLVTTTFPVAFNTVNDNAIKHLAEAVWPAGLFEVGGVAGATVAFCGSADTGNKIFRWFMAGSSGATAGNQPGPGGGTMNSASNLMGQGSVGFAIEDIGASLTWTTHFPYGNSSNQAWFDSTTLAVNADTAPVYLALGAQLAVASSSMGVNGGFAYYIAPR
jgi:hypothetical protein